MKKLRILLADLKYFNRYTKRNNFIPLNIGYIASYAHFNFGRELDIALFSDPTELLEEAKSNKPDIVGLSFYYWNTQLNKVVINLLRKMYGDDITLVFGGPSIDSDPNEQKLMCQRYPEIDAFTVDEGELGFANIIERHLSYPKSLWKDPIDGAVFSEGESICAGKPVGLSLDLETLPSPYLNGMMHPFLDGEFMPMIQTSRLCPYTCTFCVSGKNKGKLRAFPIEQVKEELRFICKRYSDRPHFMLTISDENFGILKRDVEIADYILECSKNYSYPLSLYFYNDKRFQETSRDILSKVGHLVSNGLTFSLQTESKKTLGLINRTNLSDDALKNGIAWAAELGLQTTTELIFGLPEETKESFVSSLSAVVDRGFDSVVCHNLMVMDGTELNRKAYRDEHLLETKLRPLDANYGYLGDQFVAEYDEIVIKSKSFDYKDYLTIRGLNFLFYLVFVGHFFKPFFQYIRHLGVPLADYFEDFLKPSKDVEWPKDYLIFLNDFWHAVETELFADEHNLKAHIKSNYDKAGDVVSPPRHNVNFTTRMIYLEKNWINSVLMVHLERNLNDSNTLDRALAHQVLELCTRERIDLNTILSDQSMKVEHDFIGWRRNKFSVSLQDMQSVPRYIKFQLSEDTHKLLTRFCENYSYMPQKDFYYTAMQQIVPRNRLLYDLVYEDE
jgi:radical SAM superfamily enzyme YgiQ (UPF0313 family)